MDYKITFLNSAIRDLPVLVKKENQKIQEAIKQVIDNKARYNHHGI